MAIASVGTLGTAGNGGGSTTVVLTTSATAEAGNLILVMVGKENTATSSSETNEITGLADSASNTWTKLGEYTYSEGAGADGATVALFFCRLGSEIASGGTITATFSASSGGRLIAAWEFTCASAIYAHGVQTTGANSSTNPGSLTIPNLASDGYLAVRAVRADSSVTITVSSGYTQLTGDNLASSALRGEFLISTATSFTSAPTMSGSSDSASVFAVLSERILNASGLFFHGTF